MIVARWQIDARFGHKQKVIDSMKRWHEEVGTTIGWTADKVRMTTGSVGALESTVQVEVTLEDLSELDRSWKKLATLDAHAQWSKELEPYIVSGTPRWEVLRVI
ncbi:MAG: hypothetical protein ACQEXJ_12115 [Myxococcota bacterium]